MKDYYLILGIPKGADEKALKEAYRNLARQHHPDVNPGSKRAEETFRTLNEAYDVLSDSAKRADYDWERWKAAQAEAKPPAARKIARPQTSARPSVTPLTPGQKDSAGLGGLLDGWLRRRANGHAEPPPAASARANGADRTHATSHIPHLEQGIDLTLEQAVQGGTYAHAMATDELCVHCRGTGMLAAGRKSASDPLICPTCQGVGRRASEETIQVKIPAGITEGAKLRLKGKGARAADGQRGDLLLTVRLQKHPRFERDGQDLQCDAAIPYTVAALGGQVEIETLTGRRILAIPPGVQCGQKLRLAGQGLPGLKDHLTGDLFVQVQVQIPKDLSLRERSLLRELAALRSDAVQR